MLKNISIRVPNEIIEDSEELAGYEYTEKSMILRDALRIGIDELKKKIAIKLYSQEKITISEAADIANISVGEIIEILAKQGIKAHIDLKDISESLNNALELIE